MPTPERDDDAPFTLTHARLRAAQGDLAAARRILAAVLGEEPGNSEATALLAALTGSPTGPRRDRQAGASRRGRLERWLESIRRQRGARRDAR